jgi:pyruvate/2-oxoacid:ferredoxin oxidoreductase beta subunit
VQANTQRNNSLNSGHSACQGCGEALGARYAIDAAMQATNGQLIAANATGCLEVFSTPYPETSWQMPWIHSLFGNTAAVATGIAAAMRVKGRNDQCAWWPRAATAARPTSASAAFLACSSATTMCSTSATTTRPT